MQRIVTQSRKRKKSKLTILESSTCRYLAIFEIFKFTNLSFQNLQNHRICYSFFFLIRNFANNLFEIYLNPDPLYDR